MAVRVHTMVQFLVFACSCLGWCQSIPPPAESFTPPPPPPLSLTRNVVDNLLGTDPGELALLMSESPMATRSSRRTTAQLMFEVGPYPPVCCTHMELLEVCVLGRS